MSISIGTSGWSYDHWQGLYYPPGIPQRDRLAYYVERYVIVEVNSTCYRWPADGSFANWYRRLPEGFRMTVKAPRGLTHALRLYAPETWLARMLGGLRYLGAKRGVLLTQSCTALEKHRPMVCMEERSIDRQWRSNRRFSDVDIEATTRV